MSKWSQRLKEHLHPVPQNNIGGFEGESLKYIFNESIVPEEVLERSAIQEYDGHLSRKRANESTERYYDIIRPRVANDTGKEQDLYRHYISRWQPEYAGDLPVIPPCTMNNRLLWKLFWKKVESSCHE